MTHPIQSILVANRSEIAIRVFRAANELGMRTVGIYAHEDRFALHRFKADEAYEVGRGLEPVAAYLNVAEVVRVALEAEVDAVHPGYGFLSESPELAAAVRNAGLIFIGPSETVLRSLGDKVSSRKLAVAANVPVVPATDALPTDHQDILRAADAVGLPVMVKASWGGGGRGMRRVYDRSRVVEEVEAARREALAAFGKDDVYLEKLVEHARHVEVQILGDSHGQIVHLFERDCSVQRRNQKVVEVAPATWMTEDRRQDMCQAALRLAEHVQYENAGTVEFLYDVKTDDFYFIEVNPRVQVEHTVTEEVTGVDIVKAQIHIAGGARLEDAGVPLEEAKRRPKGVAIQARVTTEDPANQFLPDYGRIIAYRSPAGYGIRLDGGTAYSGAVVTPFYDSLLVKATATANTREEAIARLHRALREFRIRGLKTNLPFLQRVIEHTAFATGELTTRFIDDTPALFDFTPSRDRGSRLLNFMGEVLINGNPEVAGRPAVTRAPLTTLPILPADGVTLSSRDRLRRDGPKALADWVVDQKQLLLTDTTFRDAHQSLLATRMRTVDLIAPLPAYECGLKQLFSLEVWGGATFDVAYRFLKEDPWQRLRQMRQAAPSHLLQMLLRASNAVGYTNYPDNVVKEFVRLAYANGEGIDVFRVFDSLNWVENMRVAMDAVLDAGGICEAALCYSGDLLSPDEDVYTLSYYVRMAKQLEAAGAHILAIKDMAGVCKPAAAVRLVTALKNEVGLPIHLHTHDTSGGAVATVIAAAGAGVDIVDGAMDALSGKTSQPNLGTVIEMLRGLERDPDVPRKALDEIVRYWEAARKHYAAFETELKGGMSSVYQHAMPGGQYTNLKVQARALGIEHRWPEVVQRYADVNQLFGNIVKVTPSSKVVGDMALFMVSQGLSVDDVMSPEREVAFPASVVKFFRGELGQPVGGFPAALQAKVLRGAEAITVRPGSLLPPADFHAERQAIAQALGTIIEHISDEDVCASLLYPKVFASFAQHRAEFGDTSILPTPTFFYGAQPGEEINVQIDAGKRLILRYLGESPTNDMKGRRSIFFELNGTPRVVVVRDKNATGAAAERPIATGAPGEVAAPMPGTVVSVAVSEGQSVSKGEVLITLEAMKMESTMYAEQGGTIRAIHVAPGDAIDVKDLLLEMDLA